MREDPGTLTSLIEEVVRGAAGAPAEAWADGLRAGTVVGRYQLRREVGRGGFGVVWEAIDLELGRTVAFKALRVGREAAREQRLLAEAEVAARLSHPNIVTVLDVGRSASGVYLVLEYLSGEPLSRRLESGPLPLREALRVGAAVARGLAHAHAHGVVHRDLKPENVQHCDDGQVKLLDLGMAAALGRRKLEGGTPAWMAPEQARAAPEDERTDVYALGALLYRMLTGEAPVPHHRMGRPRSEARGLDVPRAPALGPLVESMLAEDPVERPRDAGAVLPALEEIEAALPPGAGAGRVKVRPPPRRRWIAAGLAAGVAATLAVVVPGGLWLRGGPAAGAPPFSLVLAASSLSRPCAWASVVMVDFDDAPPGARWRNGQLGSQRAVRRDDRGAWLQASDWNQLFLPLPQPAPDVFAVEAAFLAPPPTERLAVTLHVFGDPGGPMDSGASAVVHGRGLSLVEQPGRPPAWEWGVTDGLGTRNVATSGTLPSTSLSGAWHVLRIEGSRSGCWLRASLDGTPLLAEVGECDLAGQAVMLGSNGGSYVPSNVAWRALRVLRGEPGCR